MQYPVLTQGVFLLSLTALAGAAIFLTLSIAASESITILFMPAITITLSDRNYLIAFLVYR